MTELKHKIKSLPNTPGVYHFLDAEGVVLYVGKAKNLKNRLKQYFLKDLGRGPAIEQMVVLANDIKWIETESEIEAVILEAELIKKLKPKYNIRLKDDKSFLAIRIAKNTSKTEPQIIFPIVELVRYRNVDFSDKSADYFGPYPSGELLKSSLRILRKIFPYRDCTKTKFNTYRRKHRTCIYGDLRVCSGPCNDWVNEEQYAKNIEYLKEFLRGRKKNIIVELEKEMKELSKSLRYEEASLVRNKLMALDHIKNVALGLRDDVFHIESTLFHRIECYDISNIMGEYAVGSMVVSIDGKPDKSEYKLFKIKMEKGSVELPNNDLDRLRQVLERRFKNDWAKPDLLVVDGGELHLKVAKEVLAANGLDIPLVSISKGAKRDKNDFHFASGAVAKHFLNSEALKNIIISARDESHRFAIQYYRKLHLRSMLES
ncbi:MAG: GIY-YIG nuclease family protein [bacterium]